VRRRVEIEATIGHSVERVFDYLADPTRWHEFAPAVVLRRQIGEGPVAVGTRWEAVDRIGPFRVRFTDELAIHETNRRVVWISSAPWNARTEYACRPGVGGTRVRARYEGDVAGWLRPLGLVPGPMLARVLRRDFVHLDRVLAAAAPIGEWRRA
jgi:uncharacterized protein YndB with AHSA1/START domain